MTPYPALLAFSLALTSTVSATSLLVFTKTTGFRHDSIPEGIAAIQQMASAQGWAVTATEDASTFTEATLQSYDAVVFLNTTGDVLDADQMAALRAFLQAGKGFVGVHSASDTEKDDPWYPTMLGARFVSHPKSQTATLHIHHREDPIVAHLDATWERFDEWYDLDSVPPADATVFITLDESSIQGAKMGDPHPLTWKRFFEGGRVFYTALGHTKESYAEPKFLELLRKGILWAAGG